MPYTDPEKARECRRRSQQRHRDKMRDNPEYRERRRRYEAERRLRDIEAYRERKANEAARRRARRWDNHPTGATGEKWIPEPVCEWEPNLDKPWSPLGGY